MKRKNEVQQPQPSSSEKVRKCLVCGEKFLSTWAGNRVCKRCKATAAWRGGS